MKTNAKMARKLLGLPRSDVAELRLHSAGLTVDTWVVVLARAVKNWGRRGSEHLFPVPHSGVTGYE